MSAPTPPAAGQHEKWSSGTTFMLATIGAAVGLGNLWRFPFITGQNGGAAFVLIYVVFVLGLCVPIIVGELVMGRRGGGSAIATMRRLTAESAAGHGWRVIGWLSIAIPLVGMSYYSVVAGWSVDYIVKAAFFSYENYAGAESEAAFAALLASPGRMLFFHGLFIAAAVLIVARGVGRGIELVAKYMMPALFILLVVLVANAVFNADIEKGLEFLFLPSFDRIDAAVVFMAMGQAFFSVAIGVGVMITYGAYVPQGVSLPRAAVTVAVADTAVALLAGVAIFPVVFANDLNAADGPGLIFVTLPVAFGNMPAGHLFGLLFFILLFFAAFTTVVGMLEPVVSWLEEQRGFSRPKMTALTGASAWLIGIIATLSFNVWSDVRLIESVPLLREKSLFDLLDFLIASLLIPVNAVLISVFAGWVMSRDAFLAEFGPGNAAQFRYVRFVLRYVAPLLIFGIIWSNLG